MSENYLHVEKETVRKEKFWIAKYVADAFDGKTQWLLIDEEELRGKYQYGNHQAINIQKEFESFRGTPYGQNAN